MSVAQRMRTKPGMGKDSKACALGAEMEQGGQSTTNAIPKSLGQGMNQGGGNAMKSQPQGGRNLRKAMGQ